MHVVENVAGRVSREELLREPWGPDAIGIRDLAAATGALDLNSTYAYLLLATDFASRASFGAFARRHGVPLTEAPHFGADLLDADGGHEDEPILRIGPIATPLPR